MVTASCDETLILFILILSPNLKQKLCTILPALAPTYLLEGENSPPLSENSADQ